MTVVSFNSVSPVIFSVFSVSAVRAVRVFFESSLLMFTVSTPATVKVPAV